MTDDTWERLTLAELVEEAVGGLWGSPSSTEDPSEIEVVVLRGADFRLWDERRAQAAVHRRIPVRSLERRVLRPGDLVLEVSGGGPSQPVGRVLVVDDRAVREAGGPLICSNFCRKLRLKSGVNPFFVKRQIDWLYASGHMSAFQTSTTNIRNLQVNQFLDATAILLPQPATQAEIATFLELLGAKRKAAANSVSTARKTVERFKQAILASACSGRLTADWRDQHPDQPAVLNALDKHEKRDSSKRSRAIAEFISSDLPELPDTWVWAPLAAVSESVLGKMLDREKNRGEPRPYLRNVNVRWRSFDLTDVQDMRFEPGEEERYRLRGGDVLVCEGGEPGRAAVWRDEPRDMRYQKALHRVRCDERLLPEWLVDVLQNHAMSGFLRRYLTGSGIAHLTGVSLARVAIPLPPIAEQTEVVRRVERHLTLADGVQGRLEAVEESIDRSSRAVLARAFRTELEDQPEVLASGHG